jgi:3-methyladenine DNA glycosylase AlkD
VNVLIENSTRVPVTWVLGRITVGLDVKQQVASILAGYDSAAPKATADALRELWLQFEPKSVTVIKPELREQQETVGTPVQALDAIGKEIGKVARERVDDFVPLMRLLWNEYGREGKGLIVRPLGEMELADPETIVPLVMALCRTCVTWEDADRLAMYALEPIVRKQPEVWLDALGAWLADENKWLRRAGVTVAGRLAMKHPAYTARCLDLAEQLLLDDEVDVKKATSFALRLCARGEVALVRDFLAHHVPPQDPAATWVLCDAVRSMAKKLLPEFASLLPLYERWAADPGLDNKDRRSIESAVKVLRQASS